MHAKSALLALASLGALVAMPGCEADESAPNRPEYLENRNAERRELEKPQRLMPTNSDLPGQSLAPQSPQTDLPSLAAGHQTPVLLLSSMGASAATTQASTQPNTRSCCPFRCKSTSDTTSVKEAIQVPGTDREIPAWWGDGAPMAEAPQRPWPRQRLHWVQGVVQHNPTYYVDLDQKLTGEYRPNTQCRDILLGMLNYPWFLVNTAALPVEMALQHPFKEVQTRQPVYNPNYLGYLPARGPVHPVPQPGQVNWSYPWDELPKP